MKDDIQSPFSREPLLAISKLFPLLDFHSLNENQLNAGLLTELQEAQSTPMTNRRKRFVCQDSLLQDSRYYEQIINEDNIIPTRKGSWHDFFNGLIWLRFPRTKAYLNNLHMSEIKQHGLHPRTKIRNHITHFDECGIVLFIKGPERLSRLHEAFEKQQWSFIFCELQDQWYSTIWPLVFGHANLEMLLKPFIGLTGKVLLIEVNENQGFDENVRGEDAMAQQMSNQGMALDTLLLAHIQQNNCLHAHLHDQKPFYPLPILGIPRWHYAQQDETFYANTSYFMPKRQQKAGV